MKKILLISASPNPGKQSTSRKLGEYACERLSVLFPNLAITRRDLSQSIPSPITPKNISAIVHGDSSTPEAAAHLKESNELSDELEAADQLIIATPLYNLFVPAGLKAYIDLIVRRDKTFRDTPSGPKPLLANRPVLVIITAGGPFLNSDNKFLTTYFKRTFGFIGIHDVTLIYAENQNMGEKSAKQGFIAAKHEIDAYANLDTQP